jgi:hypothetical protein
MKIAESDIELWGENQSLAPAEEPKLRWWEFRRRLVQFYHDMLLNWPDYQ